MRTFAKRTVVLGALLSQLSRLREEVIELRDAIDTLAHEPLSCDDVRAEAKLRRRYVGVIDELVDCQFFMIRARQALGVDEGEFDGACEAKWTYRDVYGKNKDEELNELEDYFFGDAPVGARALELVNFAGAFQQPDVPPSGIPRREDARARSVHGTHTEATSGAFVVSVGDDGAVTSRKASVADLFGGMDPFAKLQTIAGLKVRKENSAGPDIGVGGRGASDGAKGTGKVGFTASLSSDDAAVLVRLFEQCVRDIRDTHNL